MGISTNSTLSGVLATFMLSFRYTISALCRFFSPPMKNEIPSIKKQVLLTSATELARKIRTKELMCQDVVKCFIERIKETNPIINGIIEENFEQALQEALKVDNLINISGQSQEELAKNKPLLGVPFTVKSNLACKGLLQEGGLLVRKGTRAEDDAVIVGRLKEAGAIVIGVTNVPEMSTSYHAFNKIYGHTRNPHDISKTPGGSSGGESAIISVAGSVLGVGNDLCGSLRMPASVTGIFAHKPTTGIVSNVGMFPPAQKGTTVDQVLVQGPLTRYAEDLSTVMKIITEPSHKNNLDFDEKVDLSNIKVLFWDDDSEDILADPLCKDTKWAISNVVSHLSRKYGVTPRKVSFPGNHLLPWIIGTKNLEEGAVKYGKLLTNGNSKQDINFGLELCKYFFKLSNHTFDSIKFGILNPGTVPEPSVLEEYRKIETNLRTRYELLFDENTVLIAPSWPKTSSYPFECHIEDFNMTYYMLFGMVGAPVTNCPVGTDSEGYPVGIQVAGAPFRDCLTIEVAKEIEKEFGGWVKPCQVQLGL